MVSDSDSVPAGGRRSDALVRRGGAVRTAGDSPKVRLQRVLADAGVAARRACETMIEGGRVAVNGEIVRRLPAFVDPGRDSITVDGRPIPSPKEHPRLVYLLLNKPPRTLTVNADEPGADRQTVFDLVKYPGTPRLFAVGRLEYEATGLVLLTNDGELANLLTHPRYGVPKTYHALVRGTPDDATLAKLEKAMHKDQLKENRRAGGIQAGRVEITVGGRDGDKTVLEITLREGRNAQVSRVLSEAGWPVRKLTQVRLGPLELKGVGPGRFRELDRDELAAVRRLMRDLKGGRSTERSMEPQGKRGVQGRPKPQRGGRRGMGADRVSAAGRSKNPPRRRPA